MLTILAFANVSTLTENLFPLSFWKLMKDVPVIDKMDNLEIEASTKIYDWLPLLSLPSKKRSDVQGDCSTY